MPDNPNQPARLGYAPSRCGRRRRVWRRLIVAGLLVAALAGAGSAKGPWAWRRGWLLYRQYQCATYDPPADQVVYDEAFDPAARSADPGLVPVAGTMVNPADPQTARGRAPACWDAYEREWGRRPWGPEAVVFLHERRTTAGVRRIVRVTFSPGAPRPCTVRQCLYGELVAPATWAVDPAAHDNPGLQRLLGGYYLDEDAGWRRARLFAGRADPSDASHFAVGYEVDGRSGTIDGWLEDVSPPGPANGARPVDAGGDVFGSTDVTRIRFKARDGPEAAGG